MRLWAKCGSVLGSTVLLAGCANFSELRTETPSPSPKDIITAVECDLARGVARTRDRYQYVDRWSVLITVTLQVDTSDTGDLSVAVIPPMHPGTLTIGLDASQANHALSTRDFNYTLHLDDLELCSSPPPHVTGTIGVGNWLYTVFEAIYATQNAKGVTDNMPSKEINETVDFSIKRTGGLTPTFEMIPANTTTIGGHIGLSTETTVEHKVLLTFTPTVQTAATPVPTKRRRPPRSGKPGEAGASPSTMMNPRTGVNDETFRRLKDAQSNAILRQLLPQ